MYQISTARIRKITAEVRQVCKGGVLSAAQISKIARKIKVSDGDVIGVARDINIEIETPNRQKPNVQHAPNAAQPRKGAEGSPISDLVKSQILSGHIFKTIRPFHDYTEEERSQTFVLAKMSVFLRERKAIRRLISWYESRLEELAKENADLKSALEKHDADRRWVERPVISDAEIAARSADSFFNLGDPRE